MKTSKKLFLLLAIIFFGGIVYISYDISTKTTFPGSSPQLQERLLNDDAAQEHDTTATDSVK